MSKYPHSCFALKPLDFIDRPGQHWLWWEAVVRETITVKSRKTRDGGEKLSDFFILIDLMCERG